MVNANKARYVIPLAKKKRYARTKNGTKSHKKCYTYRMVFKAINRTRVPYTVYEPYLACVPKMALRTKNGFTYQIQYAYRKTDALPNTVHAYQIQYCVPLNGRIRYTVQRTKNSHPYQKWNMCTIYRLCLRR